MPRLTQSLPKYRKHISGQARVTLDGKTIYLGPYGTKASKAEYDRVVGEWQANGRTFLRRRGDTDTTILELVRDYWRFAKGYYKPKPGQKASELACLKSVLKIIRRLYGDTPAVDFGPLALKSLQHAMVKKGWCRKTVNKQLHRARRLFKWAAANERVPGEVYHGLLAVEGLKKGKTTARETDPVRPVLEAAIAAVKPLLSKTLQAMIDIQELTGMRPGELVIMRTGDIDTTGDVWVYRPQRHKGEHRDSVREVYIGPRARAILEPMLRPDLAEFIFSPRQSVAEKRAADAAKGKRRRPDQKPNKRLTKRRLNPRYTTDTYRQAVKRACDLAFPNPTLSTVPAGELTEEQAKELKTWRKNHRWHPHQLRHSCATRLRRDFGVDTAGIILGHDDPDVTLVYAEADRRKGIDVMARVG